MIGSHIIITNELARVVGQIADKHPDCSIQIEWHEGKDEREWEVVASDGVTDHVYDADDEAATFNAR